MSLLSDLYSTLDKRSLGGIAKGLGESDQAISRGIQPALGTVLGGMASNSDNPTLLQRLLDLAPAGDVSWSTLGSAVADPNSPQMGAGKRMLSTLFGGSEGMITRALGTGTGLQPSVASSLLAMCAPMVMSFLGKRVRDEGMNMSGLGSLLQREIPAIRAALPAGVNDLLWPGGHERVAAAPVVAQTVTSEKSRANWLLPLLLLVLIPGLWWLFSHGRRPAVQTPPAPTGSASRAVPEYNEPTKPSVPKPVLPGNADLYFDTGSTRLRPDSQARLDEFAGALATNRDAHVTINGYTDSVGTAASNMRLSQERANAVKDDLVSKGISADRLTVQGYGEENPIADNATTEGRGTNRRVSVEVAGGH